MDSPNRMAGACSGDIERRSHGGPDYRLAALFLLVCGGMASSESSSGGGLVDHNDWNDSRMDARCER